jgi:hypothetical protein
MEQIYNILSRRTSHCLHDHGPNSLHFVAGYTLYIGWMYVVYMLDVCFTYICWMYVVYLLDVCFTYICWMYVVYLLDVEGNNFTDEQVKLIHLYNQTNFKVILVACIRCQWHQTYVHFSNSCSFFTYATNDAC